MSYVNRKRFVILSYLFMITIQLFYSAFSRGVKNSALYFIMLILYSILSFLAFKGNKVATWMVIISIFLSGIGTFLIGIFLIPINQATMKVTSVLLGLYFIYAGIELVSGEKKRRAVEDDRK